VIYGSTFVVYNVHALIHLAASAHGVKHWTSCNCAETSKSMQTLCMRLSWTAASFSSSAIQVT